MCKKYPWNDSLLDTYLELSKYIAKCVMRFAITQLPNLGCEKHVNIKFCFKDFKHIDDDGYNYCGIILVCGGSGQHLWLFWVTLFDEFTSARTYLYIQAFVCFSLKLFRTCYQPNCLLTNKVDFSYPRNFAP